MRIVEVIRCMVGAWGRVEEDEDDVPMIDISGTTRRESVTKIVLIGARYKHLLKCEEPTDVMVNFSIYAWGSMHNITDWIEMSEGTEGCNILNVDNQVGINFKLLMQPEKKGVLSNEKEDEKKMTNTTRKYSDEEKLTAKVEQYCADNSVTRNGEREKQKMKSTSISQRNLASVTGFRENKKRSVLSRQSVKNHEVKKAEMFDCGSESAMSDVREGCNQLSVNHKEGGGSSTVYESNREIKYGTSTWYYNRRIAQKEKRQQVRNEALQKRKEIEEGWEVGPDIELDGDTILAGMIAANVSWVETRWGLNASSRMRLGKNARKTVHHER